MIPITTHAINASAHTSIKRKNIILLKADCFGSSTCSVKKKKTKLF